MEAVQNSIQPATYKQLHILFNNTLNNIYDKTEIDAIFYRLMLDCFGMGKSKVVTENQNHAPAELCRQTFDYLKRLQRYEPLQYITSKAHFCELELSITSGILIPRPETEELLKLCLNDIPCKSKVLDIGTGSGCIALAIAKNSPKTKVTGIDISDIAIETAKRNAKNLNLPATFLIHDIFDLPPTFYRQRFNTIVSNPPYVRNSEKPSMHRNVTDFEPSQALFVNDNNPLVYYRKIAEIASQTLAKNGTVWVEINEKLGQQTANVFNSYFDRVDIHVDFKGKDRFVRASEKIGNL